MKHLYATTSLNLYLGLKGTFNSTCPKATSKPGLILISLKWRESTQGCQGLIFAPLSALLLIVNLSASPFECSSKNLLILVERISPPPPPFPHSPSLTRHYSNSHTSSLIPPSSLYTEFNPAMINLPLPNKTFQWLSAALKTKPFSSLEVLNGLALSSCPTPFLVPFPNCSPTAYICLLPLPGFCIW